jgi:23S rRNA (adenine-N6)-dimethyltransferase
VLDLGAGSGRLTCALAAAARRVIAVELDPRLARGLRGRWDNVEVVEGDATALRLPDEPFRVVANIPFDRTNELLRLLLDDPATRLVRADLVVEWGVAVKRALPWPSTVNGVVWGAFYEASLARRLPRHVFSPAPAVDAGLLVVRRRARPLVRDAEASAFRRYVARGFRHGPASVAGRCARGIQARDLDAAAWASLFVTRARNTKKEVESRRFGD